MSKHLISFIGGVVILVLLILLNNVVEQWYEGLGEKFPVFGAIYEWLKDFNDY